MPKYAAYEAAAPYFDLVRLALVERAAIVSQPG